ncbi:unnamed protein product [Prunus brigantina]
MSNKYSAIERLAKLLMLAGVTKLPMHLINRLKWDMGPPHDIVGTLDDFFDYSGAFGVEDVVTGKVEIGFGVLFVGERSLLSLCLHHNQPSMSSTKADTHSPLLKYPKGTHRQIPRK